MVQMLVTCDDKLLLIVFNAYTVIYGEMYLTLFMLFVYRLIATPR